MYSLFHSCKAFLHFFIIIMFKMLIIKNFRFLAKKCGLDRNGYF